MTKRIKLTQGQYAIVDDEDYDKIKGMSWYTNSSSCSPFLYAATQRSRRDTQGKGVILMHRLITNCPDKMRIDHINGNTLDNRRQNLRIVTASENGQNRINMNRNNTSGVRNVYWHPFSKLWHIMVLVNRRSVSFGYCRTLKEAKRRAEFARKSLGFLDNKCGDLL